MSKIILGKSGRENVSVDLTTLLRTRLLAQANSGGGKSYFLRRLAEQLFGKVQTIIIDREGEFASLREKYGFVHVGEGGDTPADLRSAKLVAEKLLELNASAVIDLYEAFRKKPLDRRAYVADFLETLIDAPKKLWRDLVVIVDEAHQFCPQESPKGKDMREREIIGRCKDAMVSLATVGRKRGYCAIWVTQRLAKLDKDASAELMNRLVGMTFEDVDVDRASELMSVSRDEKGDFKKALKNLDPGHFYGFGRAISKDRILVKIGPVITTHPEPGSAKHAAAPPPPPEKIRAMLPKLKDLPQVAETKAKTEADLRQEIKALKSQLAVAKIAKPEPKRPVAVETKIKTEVKELPVLSKREWKRVHKAICELEKISGRLSKVGEMESYLRSLEKDLGGKLSDAVEAAENLQKQQRTANQHLKIQAPPRPLPKPTSARTDGAPTSGNGDPSITNPQRRILGALAEFQVIGIDSVPRTWVAAWLSIKASTGNFKNNVSSLRTGEYLVYDDDKLRLTEMGRFEAPAPQVEITPMAILERACQAVTNPQAKILRIVHHEYPEWISREDVAGQLGIQANTGNFKNNVSAIRTAGMFEYGTGQRKNMLRCSEWMFVQAGALV